MKFIKSYGEYKESIQIDLKLTEIDINESLGVFYDTIMKSIGAEEMNLFDTFELPKSEFSDKLNLDVLTTNPKFIKNLTIKNLKKSNVTNSEDFETFLNKPCKFMLIHKIDLDELQNPDFIVFQSWNDNLSNWEEPRLFKVTGDIKNFYDKLSSKVIEIEEDGKNYIYNTTNGNEWILQNPEDETEIYQKYFRKDDFQKMINDRKAKINII
jgi:hypothetical protein